MRIDTSLRKPRLQDFAPSDVLPPKVDAACDRFDGEYYARCARLERAYHQTDKEPASPVSPQRAVKFDDAVWEVRRTKFLPPTREGPRDADAMSTLVAGVAGRGGGGGLAGRGGGGGGGGGGAGGGGGGEGSGCASGWRRRCDDGRAAQEEGSSSAGLLLHVDGASPVVGGGPRSPPRTPVDRFWSPRVAWSEGHSLFETEEIKLQRFQAEWKT